MHKKIAGKLLKTVFAVFIAGSMVLGSATVQAAGVSDLSKSSVYASEAIQWMANNSIISGDNQGNFNPRQSITRAELITLLVKALDIDTENLPSTATFSDVPVSHWAFKYVEAANRAGITSGTGSGKFGINSLTTREQVTTMLLNYLCVSKEAIVAEQGLDDLLKFKDAGKMSDWAKASIKFAVSNNIMSGVSADSFSPSGKATKEQIAVILYKFVNSKESIEQNAAALKKVIVTYNDDLIKLQTPCKVIENDIMIPAEVFSKTGAKVDFDSQAGIIAIKSSTAQDKNIYMSIDNKSAYVNYTGSGNPISDPPAQDKLVTLNNAPEQISGVVLVPAKAVVDALGITMDWNDKINVLKIKDSTIPKNPQLYNAMKSMLDYKGEYSSDLIINMKEDTLDMNFGMHMSINGAINGNNSTSNAKFTLTLDGEQEDLMDYQTINIGDNIYVKNPETDLWDTYNRSEAEEEGILYTDFESDRNEMLRLLDVYGKMNISNEGKTILNGEEVSKYQVRLNIELLQGLLSADMLEYGLGLKDIYNNGLDTRMFIYVNSKGQLVKQSVIIAGATEFDGSTTDIDMTVSSMYTNIGKEIEIVSPIK
ncbi:S-layer homology domain-containing protein [Ruminiclostridium cellulolyticum]|uniref:S-layer domain protein n=1 Tax=Ruminiclostridium cellulolyticum (strain ATCC 35319 / DSM 5812 / JCM 6584 / H10) TaxID=394503 RepID=B8I1D2_RUMCH|nr:S-layer homology domain-containing protein [Ruminiclostridium cellulolyticum]ACL75730.1 S-layer domain protein [Ruminiclostridium cellulolyticum H10]